jgi:hypothetical protein
MTHGWCWIYDAACAWVNEAGSRREARLSESLGPRAKHGSGSGRGNDEHQRVQPLGHGAFARSFPEMRVAVAALSSCERESHLAQGGYLSEAQAKALMAQWRT